MKTLLFILLMALFATAGTIYGVHYYLEKLKTTETQPLFDITPPKQSVQASKKGAFVKIKNVDFRFTPQIKLNIKTLDAELAPLPPATIVNFDDLNSFQIKVLAGEAHLHSDVMKHIFQDHIFNYEGAPLKIKTIDLIDSKEGVDEHHVKLTGELKFLFWIEFEMLGKLVLDKENMKLIILAEKMTALHNPFTKELLSLIALDLEKLLQPLPQGRGIAVRKNQIIVSPYSLFPPPMLNGNISQIRNKNNFVILNFDNAFKLQVPQMPKENVSNFFFVFNGNVKFGQLFMDMIGTANMQMVDSDSKDPFDFYLKEYFKVLTSPSTKVLMQPNKSVLVEMGDYGDLYEKK
jgi:hypothetical protein